MKPETLIFIATSNPNFPPAFIAWLRDNYDTWVEFETTIIRAWNAGEKPRLPAHEYTPYLANLFLLVHPYHKDLLTR